MQFSKSADRSGLGGDFTDLIVPSHIPQREEPYAWYKHTFTIPEQRDGDQIFLRFGGVKFVSEIYVNGKHVGGHYGGWEPFELPITDACNYGQENELLVRVTDVRGLFESGVEYKPGRDLVEQKDRHVMAPIGSQTWRYGIWQDVTLLIYDDIYIEDVTVQTFVRKEEIEAKIILRNLSDREQEVDLEVAVKDGDEVALVLLSKESITIEPKSMRELILTKNWKDPKLWTPDSLHLYHLDVQVFENNRELDSTKVRFGFREFWTDGIYLVLNGQKIKFLATAGHPIGKMTKEEVIEKYEAIRGANCMAMRLHANLWPEVWYDAADECGMLIIEESALWCFANEYALDKKKFWDNMKDHWRGIIRRDKNHPSVVMYSIENEILHVGGDKVPETEKNLADLGRFVKELDPTRPIMYDGDEDPMGVADVINLHYPHEFPAHTLYPNTTYWLNEKTMISGYPRTEWEWSREKPLYIGEFLWSPARTADSYTLFLGDEAYIDFNQARAKAKAMAWEMQVEAYRSAEVAGMCPWTLWESGRFPNPQYEAVKRAYEPNAAIVKEYDNRFYADDNVDRTVFLYNDTLYPADLTLQWKLIEKDVVDASLYRPASVFGKREFSLQPAERIKTTITLKMPSVSEYTLADFDLTVKNGDKAVFHTTKQYSIFPKRRPNFQLPDGITIAVYEGGAKFVSPRKAIEFLKEGGIEPIRLESIRRIDPTIKILVIDAHALDEMEKKSEIPVVGDESAPGVALAKFVNDGGTVLVLEQNAYPQGMLPVTLLDQGCTIAFKRANPDGIFDLPSEDLFKFWRGDHFVARRTIAKPRGGGFRVLVDSGCATGLERCPLVEVFSGNGRYILSQLLLSEKLDDEPVARLVFEKLISYAANGAETRLQKGKRAKVGIISMKPNESVIAIDLDSIGVVYDLLSGKLDQIGRGELQDYSVLIIDDRDLSVPLPSGLVARLRSFVHEGGKILRHNVRPQAFKLSRENISLQRTSAVPVLIREKDEMIDGLTNEDLHWLGKHTGSWRDRTPLSRKIIDYEVSQGLPPIKNCVVLEAEEMQTPDDMKNLIRQTRGEPRIQDDWVAMYSQASVATAIDFSPAGSYTFGIIAKGTSLEGVFPALTVYLDGERSAGVLLSSSKSATYTVEFEVPAGRHLVELAFTNDKWNPETGEDRNLWIDKLIYTKTPPSSVKALLKPAGLVKIYYEKGFYLIDQIRWDGKVATSDKAARYLSNLLTNLGALFSGSTGATVISASEMIPDEDIRLFSQSGRIARFGTNGAIHAQVKFTSTRLYTFFVSAQGTQAADEYPNVRLLIDDKFIGDQQLQREGWQALKYEAKVDAGIHKITLEFTNDYWAPPEDRNLQIQELQIKAISD